MATGLKGTRYIWLRNPGTLSDRQRTMQQSLPMQILKTARLSHPGAATRYLKRWHFWAT